MKNKTTLFVVCALWGVWAAAGPSSASLLNSKQRVSASTPIPLHAQPPPPLAPRRPSTLSDDASDLSKAAAIPLSDAKLALTGSKSIVDTIAAHKSDPDFGSIWVTYDPYLVHLRLTRPNEQLEGAIAKSLGVLPVVTVKGSSSVELQRVEATLSSVLSGRNAAAEAKLDHEAGTWRVTTTDIQAQEESLSLGAEIVKNEAVRATPIVGYGGLPMYVNTTGGWLQYCTGGFMMRNVNTGVTGILTAGHCNDYVGSQRWYNGETPSAVTNQTCGGGLGDGQIMQITGGNNTIVFTNSSISQYVTNYALAGGYYIGQPVRQGRLNSGNVGTIQSYNASFGIGAGGDCTTPYTIAGNYQVNVVSIGGDSGGPLVASYGGKW